MKRNLSRTALAALVFGLAVAGLSPALAAPRTLAPVTDGDRITAPGTYDASIVYIPGLSIPGGLPDCAEKFDRQVYVGKLTVTSSAAGSRMAFVGENEDDPTMNLRASADFNSSWGGFLLGPLGGRQDALVGIDVANVVSGRVIGRVRGENGRAGVLIVKIGPGGSIAGCRFVGPGSR
ncbi:MAG: hypothetical protein ABI960_08685 [Candidatus Eisenbacteria bacterium]